MPRAPARTTTVKRRRRGRSRRDQDRDGDRRRPEHGARLGTPADADDRRTARCRGGDRGGGQGGVRTRPSVKPSALQAIGVGSPGIADSKHGTISHARNLPGWDGSFELGPTMSSELGPPVFVGNDVQVATDAEFKLGAGEPYRSLIGVFWGTGVGGGIDSRRQTMARARRCRRDRAHGGQAGRTALRLWPSRVHRGLCGPRRHGGPSARESREGSQDRPIQADGEARADPADQRDLGACAGARRPARDRVDRRSGRSARRRNRVGHQPARRRGGGDRRRARRALRAAVMPSRSPTPCSRTCSTIRGRRTVQVAALGDLGGALGAALLARNGRSG